MISRLITIFCTMNLSRTKKLPTEYGSVFSFSFELLAIILFRKPLNITRLVINRKVKTHLVAYFTTYLFRSINQIKNQYIKTHIHLSKRGYKIMHIKIQFWYWHTNILQKDKSFYMKAMYKCFLLGLSCEKYYQLCEWNIISRFPENL